MNSRVVCDEGNQLFSVCAAIDADARTFIETI